MTVILFDIDGTLIRTGGAGKAAMEGALRTAFGVTNVNDGVPYSGRTDHAIGRDLLAVHDIDPTPANQERLQAAYLARLPDALAAIGGVVCPGVMELLELLASRERVLLGLLTGNTRAGAKAKLGHFGLWDSFGCGGFGDHTLDRDDVARAAVQDVHAHLGRAVDPGSIWVVGDTPLDVQCARAVGAKAVAVATGWHTIGELAACEPDVLLADLTHSAALVERWG